MLDNWVLYFVQETGQGLIKIGISKNLKQRLHELQTGNPNKLKVLGVARFCSEVAVRRFERRLHERFATNHARGEWFKASNDLLSVASSAC